MLLLKFYPFHLHSRWFFYWYKKKRTANCPLFCTPNPSPQAIPQLFTIHFSLFTERSQAFSLASCFLFTLIPEVNYSLCLAGESLQRAKINKRDLGLYSKHRLHVMCNSVVQFLQLRIILYHLMTDSV